MFRFNNCFTVNYNLITLNRNNFTGIFIYKVFNPCLQNTCSKLTAHYLLKIGLIDFNVLSQVENFQDILIIFKTNSSEQSCNRQLLLTVNVRIHHVIYVSGKLNPRTLKGNNTRRIKFSTIGMNTLTKENAR